MTRIPVTLDRVAWIVVADVCEDERRRLCRHATGRPCLDVVALREVDLAVRPAFLRQPSTKEARFCFAGPVVALIVRVLRNAGRGQTAGKIEEQVPRKRRRAA